MSKQKFPQFSEEEFIELVVQALDELPPFLHARLENVEVLVEDEPSAEQLQTVGLDEDDLLLGLYEGIPLTERGDGYNLVPPDVITIFRLPIESICATREQVIEQVKRTVKHELAHHFGIDDDRLHDLGAY